MYTGVENIGAGINQQAKMASVGQGLMNPNQAYQSFLDGNLQIKNKTKSLGKEEFTPEKPKQKKQTPIFTRNGRIAVAILVVGFTAYALYKKYKAEKESAEIAASEAAINDTQNESISQSDSGAIPEPTAKEQGTDQIIDSTAPTEVSDQIGV